MTITFEEIIHLLTERGATTRSLTALVGPPGSGKSTLAYAVIESLNAGEPGSAGVLQMDGYHYDDRVLSERGQLSRKGAPETFDIGGLVAMLGRLERNDEDEIAVPVFDRSIEISRAGAAIIPRAVRHVVVEGNYLLLDRERWREVRSFFGTTIFISVSTAELEGRLAARWVRAGLSPSEVRAKVTGNDLRNAEVVLAESQVAEFSFNGRMPMRGGRD